MAAPTGVVWDAAPEPPRFIKLRRTNALRASAPKQWTPRSIARSLARSQDGRSLARSPAGRPSRRTTRAVSSALDCAGSPRTPITAEDDHAPCARKAAPRAGYFHGFQAFLFPCGRSPVGRPTRRGDAQRASSTPRRARGAACARELFCARASARALVGGDVSVAQEYEHLA